ncbi:MAG: Acyl-CoA thioesterase I precursor [Candidatus Accumulibacter appositus]|uniref:Acyl-CoA thioesterase I n=1 Tax=Candidatus Accumulibacter appositus TaxID=1454003 RepID=A0A011N6N4_9PROT|nr:MAG: Acyl-CoA thioesterase I precursor [Candidatus Accumulibacter appositus]
MSGLPAAVRPALRTAAAALHLLPLQRLLLATVLLLALLLATACGDATKGQALPAGSTVLAFGNSITYGTGARPGEDYPTQLAALSDWQVANAGIPGDTSAAARDRIEAALAATRPALVIVELGGNDFLRRRPAAAVKEDLRAIVSTIRHSGAQVILVAVPKFSLLGAISGRLPDSEIYAELANEEKLPLVAEALAEVLSDPELKADPIHPNADGYRQLAAAIAEQLREAGLLTAP